MRNRSALAIAKLAEGCFSFTSFPGSGMRPVRVEATDWFAEFLFENEFPGAVRVGAAKLPRSSGAIRRYVLALWDDHASDPDERLRLYRKLAGDLLTYTEQPRRMHFSVPSHLVENLLRVLELDGYQWRDGRLRVLEEDVFDVPNAEGELLSLYRELALDDLEQVEHDLKKTDELYVSGHWGDSVKHSRDVFEKTLQNAARKLGAAANVLRQARLVREQLRDCGLVSTSQHEYLRALYGWLSDDGGHANMAPQESARICRQMALSAAHFVLLRLRAHTARPPPAP